MLKNAAKPEPAKGKTMSLTTHARQSGLMINVCDYVPNKLCHPTNVLELQAQLSPGMYEVFVVNSNR